AGMGLEPVGGECPVEGDAGRDRGAGLGEADGRRERAVEAQAAVRAEDDTPGFDRARYRDGVDRIVVDRRQALREQRLGPRRGAGTPRTVVAPERRAGLGDEAEAIAADPGHLWLRPPNA